jgi:hypothetical protein
VVAPKVCRNVVVTVDKLFKGNPVPGLRQLFEPGGPMSHHCPFPVRSTDSRSSYRAGSAPGFTLCLALVAALSGYAGYSQAAPAMTGAHPAGSVDASAWQTMEPPATGYRDIAR